MKSRLRGKMAEYDRLNRRKANNNPFGIDDEEDDVDDFTFLNYPKQSGGGYMLGRNNGESYSSSQSHSHSPAEHSSSSDNRQMQLVDEMKRIEERTVLSSERSLGVIYDTEKVGIATAEELVHQREQLQNAEAKVDDVNRTLRTSQKHINSIKSMFGGIKNYFSKTPDQPRSGRSNVSTPPLTQSTLQSAIDESKKPEFVARTAKASSFGHPGMRSRGLDSNEWEDDDDPICGDDRRHLQPTQQTQSKYRNVQARLDQNLSDMSLGIGRLKGLASDLGREIEDQNELIDRITEKSETAELGVERQNKQMRQILK